MEEVKPTWRLAWGLFWRMALINFGIMVVIGLIMWLVLPALLMPLIAPFLIGP